MASFSSIGADSSYTSAQPASGVLGNASEKLQKLIADGAAYGIHFIICSSDYQTVKESMHFGMNILNKFRERIVFALSDSDAFNLIDNVNVSTLHDNTVYYTMVLLIHSSSNRMSALHQSRSKLSAASCCQCKG